MSTSSKAQAAAEPLESGKGMTSGSDEGGTKYGSGGGNDPKPGQGHGPGGGKDKDKKEQGPKG